MPDPILVSHRGKCAWLHADGSKTDYMTNAPVVDQPEKPKTPAVKRWHNPYA